MRVSLCVHVFLVISAHCLFLHITDRICRYNYWYHVQLIVSACNLHLLLIVSAQPAPLSRALCSCLPITSHPPFPLSSQALFSLTSLPPSLPASLPPSLSFSLLPESRNFPPTFPPSLPPSLTHSRRPPPPPPPSLSLPPPLPPSRPLPPSLPHPPLSLVCTLLLLSRKGGREVGREANGGRKGGFVVTATVDLRLKEWAWSDRRCS